MVNEVNVTGSGHEVTAGVGAAAQVKTPDGYRGDTPPFVGTGRTRDCLNTRFTRTDCLFDQDLLHCSAERFFMFLARIAGG